MSQKKQVPLGTRVRTGDIIPATGKYKVEEQADAVFDQTKNAVAPPFNGHAVTWVLIKHWVCPN